MKRIVAIFTLVVFFLGALYFTFLKEQVSFVREEVSVFEAISSEASLLMHFNDYHGEMRSSRNQSYYQVLQELKLFSENRKRTQVFESIFKVEWKEVWASVVSTGSKEFDFIWYIPKSIDLTLEQMTKTKGIGVQVLDRSVSLFTNDSTELYVAEFDQFLVLTFDPLLMEGAFNAINNKESLGKSESFLKVLQNGLQYSSLEIFVNYQKLASLIKPLLSRDWNYKQISQIGEWSRLSAELGSQIIRLTGSTSYSDSSMQILGALSKTEARPFSLENALPHNVVAFLWMSDFLRGESAICYTSEYGKIKNKGIFRISSINEKSKKDVETLKSVVDTSFSSKIFRLENQVRNDSSLIYFLSKEDERFCFSKDSFVYFSSDLKTLKEVLSCIDAQKLLSKDLGFFRFKQYLSSASNMIYYQSNSQAYNFLYPNISSQFQKEFSKYFDVIRDFSSIGFEFSKRNSDFFTNCILTVEKNKREKSLLSWEKQISSKLVGKVHLLENFKTNQIEILVQDELKKLYLLNKDGQVKWKKTLNSFIVGEIKLVDLFKNNKKQYVFATEGGIVCLDRFGRMVDHFPINAPSRVVSDLVILDYDKDKKYRFFIETQDGKIHGYSNYGKKLGFGWPVALGGLNGPMRYFSMNGKDYIMALTKNGEVRFLNRKGRDRQKPYNIGRDVVSKLYVDFSAGPSIVSANKTGTLNYTSMKSGETKEKDVVHMDALINVIYSDFDDQAGKEFLMIGTNSLSLMKKDSVVFHYRSDFELDSELQMIYDENRNQSLIAYKLKEKDKIFLMNQFGHICEGFPVYGKKGFDLKIDRSNNVFLAAFDEYGKLFLYQID